MSITIQRAQTIHGGVKLKGNRYIEIPPRLFEFDASNYTSGTTLLDISGNNRHATIHGSPTWDTDAGGCFIFNANPVKYIEVEGSDSGWGLAGAPARATLSVWAKISPAGYYQHIAGWRGGLSFWFLILNDGSTTEARVDNGTVYDVNINYTTYFNAWKYITLVADAANSRTKLYINSIEVGSTTGLSGNFSSANNNFTLGCDLGNSFAMNGKIGGSIVYSRALTDAEVVNEFNRTKTRYGV
jgi:Concanavalin A-like lectin/glucanases superfamily